MVTPAIQRCNECLHNKMRIKKEEDNKTKYTLNSISTQTSALPIFHHSSILQLPRSALLLCLLNVCAHDFGHLVVQFYLRAEGSVSGWAEDTSSLLL